MAQVRDIYLRGEGATARKCNDEPLGFETFQRFADRRSAEAQAVGEVFVIDRRTRTNLEHHQTIADNSVRLLGE
jgi:hypothetical protein